MGRRVAQCGTRSGYNRHLRLGEKSCPECLRANSIATSKAQKRAREKRGTLPLREPVARPYKLRTESEMDADFARLRGNTKKCSGCGLMLSMNSYSRDRNAPDGRRKRCSVNRCSYLASRFKSLAPIRRWWVSMGIDPDRCFYCKAGGFEEIGHVVPRCRSGSDAPQNRLPSCEACNRGPGGKLDSPVLDWLLTRNQGIVNEVARLFPKSLTDKL